ncbi:MAG: plastocyanin/azurin family copper-binding protein [Actinomycetota bacterium]|nr:plastocyanin/azurin family copper-binding protein [Actinomycetota bacterium]
MRPRAHTPRAIAALLACSAALVAAGCGEEEPDLANGKKLFAGEGQCGSCHALARANTKGSVGPDLDQAFVQVIRDGMKRSTIEGTVRDQIAYPRRSSSMKPGLVKGDDARDVAAYVAYAAARPGKDSGLLAAAAQPKKGPPIAAKGGKLTIPADPTGALAFTSDKANSPAGAVTIESPNESPIQHNIALKPGGPIGPVVGSGGNSTFKATLKPGNYTFYCSVPGHEEGGMKGTLTVK